MKRMIDYDDADSEWTTAVMVDKIVRLSKSDDNEYTFIHLTNKEVLKSNDSIKTLQARINLKS